MTPLIFLLGITLLGSVIALTLIYIHRKTSGQGDLTTILDSIQKEIFSSREEDRKHLQERLDRISDMVTKGMAETSTTLQGQFKESTKIIQDVTEKLTKLDETNTQVLNFSEKLQDLDSIFKSPKGKGVIGEYWLESLLSHVLSPTQFKMQYMFPNGEIVDSVIFLQDKIIPIDAKFSSEKYTEMIKEQDKKKRTSLETAIQKNLKKRIDEVAKYIRPQDSTVDFAFMFLPAEGIYYDLLAHTSSSKEKDVMSYAFSKRVIVVSPATFFAYLQTVLHGLKALKMEESVREILQKIEVLGKHLVGFETNMQKMGKHLGTTVNTYNESYTAFQRVDKDVLKLTDGKEGGTIEPQLLERPTAHIEDAFENAASKVLKS